jgi:hypothetical protein
MVETYQRICSMAHERWEEFWVGVSFVVPFVDRMFQLCEHYRTFGYDHSSYKT